MHAGEPLTVRATVSGIGNVSLWPEPQFRWPPGFRCYLSGTTTVVTPDEGRIAGTKTFDYVVVPDSIGAYVLPEEHYSYFDLAAQGYVVVRAPPQTLHVLPSTEPHSTRAVPALAAPEVQWADSLAGALGGPGWIALATLPPLKGLFASRRRARRSVRPARQAPPAPASPLGRLEHDFQVVLASHVPDRTTRDGDGLARALRAAGVDRAVADHVMRLRDRVRAARYGPHGVGDAAELAAELRQVMRVLGADADRRRVGRFVLLVLAAVLGPAGVGHAQAATAEVLYEAGALGPAVDSFAARAAAEPEVAAHWYNLGAAFYRAGADGKAVAAWTRAARLAPRDAAIAKIRALVPLPDASSERLLAVGLVTPEECELGAACAWIVVWGALVGRRRRVALGAFVVCVVALVAGEREWARRAEPLAVVLRSGTAVRVALRDGWHDDDRRCGRGANRWARGRGLAVCAPRRRHRWVDPRVRGRPAMSLKIAVLATQVADQIAAGEVVERPASVVKELVENALDAGARSIRVAIEQGGASLMRVSDDGEGMGELDARLALARHATSKIRYAADPNRGLNVRLSWCEALPAIASVARLELETASDGEGGVRLRVAGGRLEEVEPTARQRGTTVTVRSLFFNTPARRKFLRTQASETRAVLETVTVLALARPDVLFEVTSDGRQMIQAPAVERPIERVAALWGRPFADTLLPVAYRVGPLDVTGFVQRPAQAKPTGRKGYVFVHGRPVRDPFLVRAAEAGYRSTIAPGDRPSVLLFIDVPGDAVDVNVHPAKHEVRFRDRPMVERGVEEAVRRALGPLAAAVPLGAPGGVGWTGLETPLSGGGSLELFGVGPEGGPGLESALALLQVFDTYILAERGNELWVVDQHSAHERVLYERAVDALSGAGGVAQHLLVPFTLELSPAEQEALVGHRELLDRLGYEIAVFSGRSVAIHAAPNPHPRFDAAHCLAELLADLAADRFGGLANPVERFAATYACRAAVRAGQRLDPGEMRELLAALARVRLPAHDVHGRPTVVRVARDELERRFGR